jgi:hypothetical protein
MKKKKLLAVALVLLTTVVAAQTRRSKEEGYIRKSIDVVEGQEIVSIAIVCDPDGDDITIQAEDLPRGAVLLPAVRLSPDQVPNLEDYPDPNQCQECADPDASWWGSNFSWTPAYDQAGQHKFYVHAMDDNGGDDWVVYIINVANKNRPPQL